MIDLDSLVIGPCLDTFGQAVTYQPAVGSSYPTLGVFDRAYTALQPLGDAAGHDIGMPLQISETRPVLGVQLSQMATPPAKGDTLVIAGLTYVVQEVRPDGHGWAKLLLNQFYPALV